MKHDGNVVDFPVAEEPLPQQETQPAPGQEVKIVLFQIVSPNSCVFLCLSENEAVNKLEIGIIGR